MGHRKLLFVLCVAAQCTSVTAAAAALSRTDDRVVTSPNGQIRFQLIDRDSPGLKYKISQGSDAVIEPSSIGIVVDGVNLAEGSKVESIERYERNEQYPTRGVHSIATDHCRGAKFSLAAKKTNARFVLEVRCFNDGVAFRHIVPGSGARTPDAATDFTLPPGSTAWHHNLRGHYEGVHLGEPVEAIKADEWIAPPLAVKLPGTAGYAAITEAALVDYAGMALQTAGNCVFRERLGHAQPVGHPFELRFGAREGERLSHAAPIEGEIVTPWRVVMIGKDLNPLANCDIVQNVSPPPDSALFPQGLQTPWIKPGRCVWKFLDGGANTLEGMKEFTRYASELGFEYNLIEGFWQRWSDEELRSLVDYSRKRNVGIWLWKDSRALHEPEAREKFFSLCQKSGVVGVKVDFLDHEAKEVVELYQAIMKEAAQHRLMVNFHGANKPTGEWRAWPNELTREGVRGMEGSNLASRARHDTTLPFTRYLAGPGDYTPVVFGSRRGDTTAAHQIATAAVFTSPLLVYGAHPKSLLEHPAVEMIKSIPSIWDETIVLPESEIGRTAAYARRRGENWFLAVLGGPQAQKLALPLSFLDATTYAALVVRDDPNDATAVKLERKNLSSSDAVEIELARGGGFIARFSPRVPRFSAIRPAAE